ncbi:MAG: hypothetical protein ABFS12_00005 [Bacteroidota bacterium]
MKVTPLLLQRMHLITAVLLVAVTMLIALFVIQPAAVDTYPGVKHDRIVFIWGLNISFNLLVAVILVVMALFVKGKGCIITSIYILLLFIIFILGFACNDAAQSYIKHGPDMQIATITLFCCAGLEVIAWILLLTTVIQRRKIVSLDQA